VSEAVIMSRTAIAGLFVAVVLAVAASPAAAAPPQQASPQAAPSGPSVADLGVSLKSIRKQLGEAPPPSASSNLRYNFHVEVVGKEPKVDFFEDFSLSPLGGVRYGGPTHWELINMATPYPFRTYGGGFDLLSLRKKK